MSIPGRPEFRQNDVRRLRFADSDFFNYSFQTEVVDIDQGGQFRSLARVIRSRRQASMARVANLPRRLSQAGS